MAIGAADIPGLVTEQFDPAFPVLRIQNTDRLALRLQLGQGSQRAFRRGVVTDQRLPLDPDFGDTLEIC